MRTVLLLLLKLVLVLSLLLHETISLDRYQQQQQQNQRLTAVGNVVCADGHRSCWVHNSTCCPIKLSSTVQQYHCCPLAKAVCCEDGLHCCPQCFTCDIKNLLCSKPASSAAVVKMFSVLAVNPQVSRIRDSSPPHHTLTKNQPPIKAMNSPAVMQTVKKKEEPVQKKEEPAVKKESEGGFVSGVISAVRSTFFSSSKASEGEAEKKQSTDSTTRSSITPPSIIKSTPSSYKQSTSPPIKQSPPIRVPAKQVPLPIPKQAPPGMSKQTTSQAPKPGVPHTISQTQGKTASAFRPHVGHSHSQPASISHQNPSHIQTAKTNPAQTVGIKSPAAGFRQPTNKAVSPQVKVTQSQGVGTTSQKVETNSPRVGASSQRSTSVQQPTIKTQTAASKNAKEVKDESKGGFFSSVLSAVTDKLYPTKTASQEKKTIQPAGRKVSPPSHTPQAGAQPARGGPKPNIQQQSSTYSAISQTKSSTAVKPTANKQIQPTFQAQQLRAEAAAAAAREPNKKISSNKPQHPNPLKTDGKTAPNIVSKRGITPATVPVNMRQQQQQQQQYRQQQQNSQQLSQQKLQQQQFQKVSKPVHKSS